MAQRRRGEWLGVLVSLSHRLWWWLAIVSLLSLLGQEFCRSAGYSPSHTADGAELEGFGDEAEEDGEEDVPDIVVPTPTGPKLGPQTDRGPPVGERSEEEENTNVGKEGGGGGGDESHASPSGRQATSDVEEPRKSARNIAGGEGVGAGRSVLAQHGWDEDEFEGLPEPRSSSSGEGDSADGRRSGMGNTVPLSESQNQSGRRQRGVAGGGGAAGRGQNATVFGNQGGPSNFILEGAVIIFLIGYAINFAIGRKKNEKVAVAWAEHFAGRDSIMEKNFSLIGVGTSANQTGTDGEEGKGGASAGEDEAMMLKEGQNVFKFYASGRRFCEGLLATLDLRGRHDLFLVLWYFFSPRKDFITIEVDMNDEDMDFVVFAVARRKSAKAMHKDNKDLQQFATILDMATKKNWPSDEFSIIAESRELAQDLLPDAVIDQVFGEKAGMKFAENLISIHFTDQNADPSHKKLLRFTFSLPEPEKMNDLARLMQIVPYYIDMVGRHKLSAQARAKADAARAKVAQEAHKESHTARQEALQRKRAERLAALREAEEANLSKEALRRREEKNRAREVKRAMPRIKISRAH